jgi:PIN domain
MGQLVIPSRSKVYIDTSVLIYTLEENTDYFPLLQPLWAKFQAQEIELISSELILMEVLVVPLRNNNNSLVNDYEQLLFNSEMQLIPIDRYILRRIFSMGMLKQDDDNSFRTLLEDFRYKDRDFVLIDESHHLRNHGTQRYKVLETFLAAGKRCCLLTATPRNNSAWDIYHQLKLFHQDDIEAKSRTLSNLTRSRV